MFYRLIMLNCTCVCMLFSMISCDQRSRQEDRVALWLKKAPSENPYKRPAKPIPYASLKEWVDAGREIDGIEEILLDFYENNRCPTPTLFLARALGYVGSSQSVPVLIRIMEDDKEFNTTRRAAIESLWRIGDNSSVEPLCKLLESELKLPKDDSMLVSSIMYALGEIGDESAIPFMKKTIEAETESKVKEFFLNDLKKIEDQITSNMN